MKTESLERLLKILEEDAVEWERTADWLESLHTQFVPIGDAARDIAPGGPEHYRRLAKDRA